MLDGVEARTEIQGNNLIPGFIGELFNWIYMLDSSIVYQDIDFPEMSNTLLYQSLIICWFHQICVNELRTLSVDRQLFLELCDLFLGCEPIQHDIGSSGRQRSSDTETDSTERSSHDGCLSFQEGGKHIFILIL